MFPVPSTNIIRIRMESWGLAKKNKMNDKHEVI